jgi:hypothetical protein
MQGRNGGSGAAGPPVNVTCGLCQSLQSLSLPSITSNGVKAGENFGDIHVIHFTVR